MKNRNRTLLGGVSAMAVSMAFGTTIAMAASTGVSYKDDGAIGFNLVNATATGNQIIDGINANQNLVGSSINANVSGTPVLGGGASSSSVIIDSNALKASSTGNSVTSTADLEALEDGGIGIANAAVNSHAASAVVSSVDDSTIALTASTLGSGADSLTNSDNSIAAETTLNSNTISSSGAIPNSFSDATGGGSTLSFDPAVNGDLVTSDGSIATSNVQLNSLGVAGRSSASVVGNAVSTTVTPTEPGQMLSSSVETDGNSISADYAGNTSVSQVAVASETDADSGVNPTFNGSVAASNVQANLQGDEGADPDSVRASNIGSTITAEIGLMASGTVDSTLSGALSVSDNGISSSSVGNKSGSETAFGTEILVDSGISYAGTGAAGEQSNTASFDGLSLEGGVDAGLSVLSAQANVASAQNGLTENADIGATVQNLQDGTVDVSSNNVVSSGAGNDASSRILSQGIGDTGTPSFEGTAALANAQINNLSPVDASVIGTEISATVGNAETTGDSSTVADSTVTLTDNTAVANATGNTAANVVALGANSLSVGAGSASINGGDHLNGNVSVDAGASLTNLQANHGSEVTAANTGTGVGIDATDVSADVSNTTIQAKGNRVGSSAIGNDGGNTLALQGTSASGSAGIGSVQVTGTGSNVTAGTSDTVVYVGAGNGDGTVIGSTVTLDANRIAADAIANRVSNAFSATDTNALQIATTATNPGVVVGVDGTEPDGAVLDATNPTVNAALGLLNSQTLASDATASAANAVFDNMTDGLSASHVSTSDNVLHAEADGNNATNTMTLDVGSVDLVSAAADTTSAAAVANAQSRTDGSNVTSQVGGDGVEFGGRVAGTTGDVANSTVEVDGNTSEALARGNTASNELTATATSLDLASSEAMSGLSAGPDNSIAANLGFTVVNAQASGTGNVSATQSQVQVLASVADDVTGSSVGLSANKFVAGAFDNAADSSLVIDAGTAATSGGVSNFQTSGAATSATLGNAGVAALPGSSYNVTATNIDPATGNPVIGLSTVNIGGGNYELSGTLYSDSDMSGVAGWTEVDGQPGWYQITLSDYVIDTATYNALSSEDGGSFAFAGTSPGTDGVPGTPSVIAQVGGDISNSSISVADSVSQATAISNSANNTVTVSGDTVAGGSGITAPGASIDLESGDFVAASDFAVSNVQGLDGDASASAEANGTYAVEADGAISGSDISVTGTRQQATAEGNQATNGLSLSATNLDGATSPTASLLSAQVVNGAGTDPISATGWMDVHAPAASTNSSIDLSDNRNVALAIANDVDNGHVANGEIVGGLNVSGTNVDGQGTSDASAATGYPFSDMTTVADYMANNAQSNDRDVAASVATTVQNQDSTATDTAGLQNGTANLSDNVSIAEARGNIETTAVAVAADANVDATSALLNTQVSDADIVSTADSSVTFALNSDYSGASTGSVNNSSVGVSGNQVVARSVSNDASNVSLVSGTNIAAVEGNAASAAFGGLSFTTSATHVINSGQASSGVTSATATGSVSADLVATDLTEGTAVSESSVLLNGNVTAAEARGNNASNELVLDGSASLGATGAVLNAQTRSIDGAVTASATGSVYLTAMADLNTGTAALGSSVGVTDNVTQAVASANSATNTLTASAGAGYGPLAGIASGSSSETAGSVDAAYGVLNGQMNDASVSATASATYEVGMVGGVTGSALNANGNTVLASAVGNSASNGLVLSALPGENPSSGISSTQVNTGAISAMVTGTSISLSGGTLGEGVVGSSLGVRGNSISAGATGNSVVNSIKAR